MEIRDVVHGSIEVQPHELAVVDSQYFQRLRQIKQLGFGEYSFPAATHNRYIHSLGAMETATRAFRSIFDPAKSFVPKGAQRFLPVLRFAALLHDVGHGPLSHTTEFAMPEIKTLGLPFSGAKYRARKATHEDYTLKIILDSPLTAAIERVSKPLGFKPEHIAALIDPTLLKDLSFGAKIGDFFREKHDQRYADFLPVLSQLISSELDADRMDYLRRDSLLTGVSYGQYDYDWLVRNLSFFIKDGRAHLALQHRALYAFEDFLISRFHMFLMVYFHYKSVIYDEMLAQYFASSECDYVLPSDIEAYVRCDDAHLSSHLTRSRNYWAKRIAERKPYRMLLELHSGIPATKTAKAEQDRLLARTLKDLGSKKIHGLVSTSTGELSKYFRKPGDPIFVRYDNHFSAPSTIPLEQCTDLFNRYSEKRSITRVYVSPEDYPKIRNSGRNEQLKFFGDEIIST